MIDIEKLKQAALAATQGEWAFGSFHELLVVPVKDGAPDKYDPIANLGDTAIPWDMDTYSAERYKNAEHIATANPSAILELITRLEELQELYASSAFNTNYWKGKTEATESQLASQELVIQQFRDALEFCSGTSYIDDAHRIVDEVLAIPTSTSST